MRRHLTYANVMSSIAVFLVLATGVAYAADTVFSVDIVDGEVKTQDIDNLTIANADLATNSVGSAKVAVNTLKAEDLATGSVGSDEVLDDSLKSEDVDESSLGQVPLAGNALTLGGQSLDQVAAKGIIDLAGSCNPSDATFRNCGAAHTFSTPVASDIVVMVTGTWYGDGAGPDAGECRIRMDTGLSPTYVYGQDGNEQNNSSHGAAISQTVMFDPLPAGSHLVSLECRETDSNFHVSQRVITLMRLGV